MKYFVLMVFWMTIFAKFSFAEENYAKIQEILKKADAEYGEYLSGQCVTCHHATGDSEGIPSIVGLQADYLIVSMLKYKSAAHGRTNPAMVNIAKNLSDEELGSLAMYFSEQNPD
ncbi:MAG: c-type cytochrome [Hyphomicrobiales bacterium]